MQPMAERRKYSRTVVRSRANILFREAETGVACIVRDISEGGAQLLLTVAGIPSEFKLSLDGETTRNCFVKWRRPNRMGVEFIPAESARIDP